jgi:hypothetical protein
MIHAENERFSCPMLRGVALALTLNPVENIWQFMLSMRDNWLSNRVFKSTQDIILLPGEHCRTDRGRSCRSEGANGQKGSDQ